MTNERNFESRVFFRTPENISLLPNASCLSTVLRNTTLAMNTTLAVVDTYLPEVSSGEAAFIV